MPRLRQPPAEGQIRHRTMAEFALEQLREAIILGELPAGTPLRLDELARSLIRPAWVRSERFRPALLASAGDPQDTHRALDERLLEACIAHRPDEAAKAFYDHLELASVFFQTELGGRGIFER